MIESIKEWFGRRLGYWCFRIGAWFLLKCFSHIVFANEEENENQPIHYVVFATDKFHIDQFAESWYKENELARDLNQTVQ